MGKKVSLRELVASKVVFAIFLAGYYWMWSRTDWQDYYQTIQSIGALVLLIFFAQQAIRINKYKKEGIDELAEENLRRCDSICLKVLLIVMAVTAYLGGILGHVDAISTATMGWIIVGAIFGLSILRTVLFIIMDIKGV